MNDRIEFFNRLYACCEGCIEFRIISPAKRVIGQPFFELVDHESIGEACEYYRKANIYFGVGTRDGSGKGAKENVVNIPALWTDVDFKDISTAEVKNRLDSFPYKPTAAVLTGHGVHFYWILKEPAGREDFARVEDLLRRIRDHFNGDPSACEIARVLRVPGTVNVKSDPVQVKLHFLRDFTYALEDFEVLPAAKAPAAASSIDYTMPDPPTWVNRCEFIRYCRENPEKVGEPAWYAMLSNLLTIRPGGASLCHEYSKGHPEYTSKETNAKILHAINHGPHTCAFINFQGTGGGKFKCSKLCGVKSPASLGFTKKTVKDGASNESRVKISFG